MFKNIFNTKIGILLLILFIVEFFRFLLFPYVLRHLNNIRLFFVIMIVMTIWALNNNTNRIHNWYTKKYDYLMICLIVCVVLNCISCLIYRDQNVFETLFNWSPVLLLYLYYPLSSANLKVIDWEKILFWIFLINLCPHIILTFVEKPYLLFDLNVSDAIYDNNKRLRLYSDGILFLGCIFSFNKSLTNKKDSLRYVLLFLMSLFAIFIMGFRTTIFAIFVVCFYIFVKIRKIKIKLLLFFVLFACISSIYFYSDNLVQSRINDITERNRTANFSNDDYVRVLIVKYYYNEYFKDTKEMIMGSGMVRRIIDNPENIETLNGKYPSNYSKQVSIYSDRFHFFPVDLGLIGLSWEAGIPAAIILLLLCFLLFIPSQEDEYYYIRGWGLFNILTCITVPFYYYHKNMIFTVIVLIIFMKLKLNSEDILVKYLGNRKVNLHKRIKQESIALQRKVE